MQIKHTGHIAKMRTELADPVNYWLAFDGEEVAMNALIGEALQIRATGHIACVSCGRTTKKSYSQGHCYPCFRDKASCDMCIVKPEQCHHHLGTCREPQWGEENCMIPHTVYLANSSGLKVGITRQLPMRWMDQGATQALPIFSVSNRLQSGLVEVAFKQHIADKTDWRKMLRGEAEALDMVQRRDELLALSADAITALQRQHGEDAISAIDQPEVTEIRYPVEEYPVKIKSFNLDKTPEISGRLQGIKGQYLIFDTGVINMRKYGGYELELANI